MPEYQILNNLLVTKYQKTSFIQVRLNNKRKNEKKRVKEGGR